MISGYSTPTIYRPKTGPAQILIPDYGFASPIGAAGKAGPADGELFVRTRSALYHFVK